MRTLIVALSGALLVSFAIIVWQAQELAELRDESRILATLKQGQKESRDQIRPQMQKGIPAQIPRAIKKWKKLLLGEKDKRGKTE